jgi:hypothetical protein
MVTTMDFLQYYLKSSTKRGWEMSSLLVAIHYLVGRASFELAIGEPTSSMESSLRGLGDEK